MKFVGVDGGGTRTRAVVLDDAGVLQGWTVGGAGNYQLIGRCGVVALLKDLMASLDVAADQEPVSLCLALAGAGREAEQAQIVAGVQADKLAARTMVVSDARAALEGALAGSSGLIIIAGTGSIVLGKNARGDEARAGGWGPLLGDEGGGYCLGLEGLRSVYRARDGWGEPTSLTQRLLEALGMQTWDDVIVPLYSGELGRARIAALAPLVLRAAASGDGVAAGILAHQGTCLGRKAAAVARNLSLTGLVPAARAGGVMRDGEQLWTQVEQAARAEDVELSLQDAVLPPVLGAALLAWRLPGRMVDAKLVEGLAEAAPDLP